MTAPPPPSRAARVFEVLFSAFLCAIAVYALSTELSSGAARPLHLLGAAAFLVLGGQGLVSAARGTRSWLARIGPLP